MGRMMISSRRMVTIAIAAAVGAALGLMKWLNPEPPPPADGANFLAHLRATGLSPAILVSIALCFGTALAAGEVRTLAGMALLVVAFGRKIRLEEQRLDAHFGTAYADYRKTTWAVVPWVV